MPYHPPPAVCTFISGALAGTVSTTTTYPLDLLRTRFAAQGPHKVYPSLLGGIKQIYANEGGKGFFRGLAAANVQIIPYMGLFFTCYETFKPILHDSSIPLNWMGSADGISGILASICSKTAVYPLDTVRKRLQVQGPTRAMYVHRNIPEYTTGVYGTIRLILRREGLRGMYRGLSVALLKAAPASAVTVWTFEQTMALLKDLEEAKLVGGSSK
jgi:solute carrier family 25 thiamine pyrophosphate transporter 19